MEDAARSKVVRIPTRVRKFYEANPFPAFDPEKYRDAGDLRDRASPYAATLDAQLPHQASIADIGCGTGQLACFLALRQNRRVLALDFSAKSLSYAHRLRARLALNNLAVVQGDVFSLPLPNAAYDYVFCNGVLHHTADPRRGFGELERITKPGGYVCVGLYNALGRVAHRTIRWSSHHLGRAGRRVSDWGLRRMLGMQFEEQDREKRHAWQADQFIHPHESMHRVHEVLRWFRETGLEYASSIPSIELGSDGSTNLFPRRKRAAAGSALGGLIQEIAWIWQLRWTGGYFIMIGRKRG